MLSVPVPDRARERGDDDLRAEAPHDPHGVLEENLFRPEAERLVDRAREAEVERPGEVLPSAVRAPGRHELLRTDQTEAHAEVRAEQVLSAVSPRERKVRGLAPHAA